MYKYNGAKEQPFLHSSLKKYGFNAHDVRILIECDRQELNKQEVYYINKYNSFNSKTGMNLTSGGNQNWNISDETRIKMKNRPKRIFSAETRLKMSISLTGKNKGKTSPRKGAILTNETKSKISKNHARGKPRLGISHSKETKEKISKANKGRIAHNKRPIINIETGVIYESKIEAAESIGMKVRTLKAKLLGQNKNDTFFRYA